MDLSSIGLFQMTASRMDYLSERHRLVAENVANANVPGYRARDLKAFDFAATLARIGPVTPVQTDARHMVGLSAPQAPDLDRRAGTYEVAPDGNAVVLEQQMLKAAETRAAYDLAAGLMQKQVGLLRHAFTGR